MKNILKQVNEYFIPTTSKEFDVFFNSKYGEFKSEFPTINDFNFTEWHIKKSKKFIVSLEKAIDDFYDTAISLPDDFGTPKDLEFKILLLEQWLVFLYHFREITELPKDEFFNTWRSKGSGYTELKKDSINNSMKEYIRERFKYFEEKYKTDWYSLLIDVFVTITNNNFLIDTEHLKRNVNLIIEIKIARYNIEKMLTDFERFFEFLIANKNLEDCLGMLNLFRNIMVTYRSTLRQSNLYFEKSYYYETINEFYERIETNYNAEKLKLFAFKVENADNAIMDSPNIPLTENIFNRREPNEVKEHFMNGLKRYANKNIIEKFLYSAFQRMKPPTVKYNFNDIQKEEIMLVFAMFYVESGSIRGSAKEYASLLSDYFEGFTSAEYVCKNWRKAEFKKQRKNKNNK